MTRLLHDAAVRQPRAGTAPALSLVTLVLVFGGYVALDRVCKADPVCRAQQVSGPQTVIVNMPSPAELAAMVGDPSTMLPPGVPFRLPDDDLLAAVGGGGPSVDPSMGRAVERNETTDARRVTALSNAADAPHVTALSEPAGTLAARPCADRAEPGCVRAYGGAVRIARLQDRHEPTRRLHGIRDVSAHVGVARRSTPNKFDIAKLYRGH
ncbi:hypothetical protein [Burkholderia sp. Ac-20353]|uniref:hypothetical protein n=1 Tax=Burkholderia sp. Ac-20353 TaxID=2703894 RepID=UPI001F12233C|nr:hypothetical protein [Burkholderia sp. Ac-20353]